MLKDMCVRPFGPFSLTIPMEMRTRKPENFPFSFIVHFCIFFTGYSERKWNIYFQLALLSSQNPSHAREMSVFRFMCSFETCKNARKLIYVYRLTSLLNRRNANTYLGVFLCYSHWKWDDTHTVCLHINRFKGDLKSLKNSLTIKVWLDISRVLLIWAFRPGWLNIAYTYLSSNMCKRTYLEYGSPTRRAQ